MDSHHFESYDDISLLAKFRCGGLQKHQDHTVFQGTESRFVCRDNRRPAQAPGMEANHQEHTRLGLHWSYQLYSRKWFAG